MTVAASRHGPPKNWSWGILASLISALVVGACAFSWTTHAETTTLTTKFSDMEKSAELKDSYGEKRFLSFSSEQNRRFGEVEKTIDKVETKVDKVDQKVDRVNEKLDDILKQLRVQK